MEFITTLLSIANYWGKIFTNMVIGISVSLTQSCPTMRSHGLQHTRLPCASPTPRACSNSYPSNQWCHSTTSSSVIPFSSCLQSFPASGSSNESVFRIRCSKYWSFCFSISPSNEYSGLISFRTDWLDLLEVQGILKSLLQHHSSKEESEKTGLKLNIQKTKITSSSAQLSLWSNSHIHIWLLEKP